MSAGFSEHPGQQTEVARIDETVVGEIEPAVVAGHSRVAYTIIARIATLGAKGVCNQADIAGVNEGVRVDISLGLGEAGAATQHRAGRLCAPL